MGYRPKTTTAASANLDITQLVPSKPSNNYEPDYDYALTVNKNSLFGSTEGTTFYTTKDARFGYSSSFEPTIVSIYQYDSNSNPEYYLLRNQFLQYQENQNLKHLV